MRRSVERMRTACDSRLVTQPTLRPATWASAVPMPSWAEKLLTSTPLPSGPGITVIDPSVSTPSTSKRRTLILRARSSALSCWLGSGMLALRQILLNRGDTGATEQFTQGVLVAVAGGEVRAVLFAKLPDGGGGRRRRVGRGGGAGHGFSAPRWLGSG